MPLFKISSQGQLTLGKAVLNALGNPRQLAGTLQGKVLSLCPADPLDAEMQRQLGEHGITKEVLAEALRVVDQRARTAKAADKC